MRIKLPKRVPHEIALKALNAIELISDNQLRPKKLTCNKALVVNIGLSWRLVKFRTSNSWELMTHETYNRHCVRGGKK
ncbi:hypothetical protein ACJZRZ_000964 [Vibrio parahaemolyticus]